MNKLQSDINFEKFMTYDEETNIGQCMFPECRTVFIGKKTISIKQHYRIAHKLHIEGDNSVPITDDNHNSDTDNQVVITDDPVLYSNKYLDGNSNGNDELYIDFKDNCDDKGSRTFLVDNYVDYQKDANTSKCLIRNCERAMSGRRTGNIKRHYHKVHYFVIVHDNQEKIRAINKGLMDYYNSEVFDDGSKTDEDDNDKEFSDELEVDFNQYIDYNPVINKSLCKVPGCKVLLDGKKLFTIERHYGLVHNYDIESCGMKLYDSSSLISVDDLVVYDTESSPYKCLFINCNQILVKHLPTIKRHYYKVHRIIIARESDNIPNRLYRKRKHGNTQYKSYENLREHEFVDESDSCFIKNETLSDDEQPKTSKRTKNRLVPIGSALFNNNLNYTNERTNYYFKNVKTEANLMQIKSNTQNIKLTQHNKMEKPMNIQITLTKYKIFQLCLGLIIERDLPLDLFDDEKYFKPLLTPFEQFVDSPLNSSIIENLLLKATNIIVDDFKNMFTDKIVCLELYVVKHENNYYLIINVRFTENEMVCNKAIGIIPINETTTSLPIFEYLSKFRIDERQIYMKTITAFHDDEKIYNICDNLCKHNPDVRNHPIYEINKILRTFLQKYSEDIKSWQKLKNFSNDSNKSFMDNLKEFGMQLKNVSKIDVEKKSNVLQELINFFSALQIFWNFLDKLAGEQYVAGDLYRDWLCIELELKAELNKNNNTYAQDLYENLNSCKNTLLESSEFLSTLYFDARFNFFGSRLLSDEQKTKGKLFICSIWEKFKNYLQTINNEDDSKSINATLIDNSNDDEYALLTQLINDTMPLKSCISMEDKLTNCVATKREPFSLDILKYWRYNRIDMDDINALAKVVFTHSASLYVLIDLQKRLFVPSRKSEKFDKFLIKFNQNILKKNMDLLFKDIN